MINTSSSFTSYRQKFHFQWGIFWLVWVLATAGSAGLSRIAVTYVQNLLPGDNLPIDILVIGLCVGAVQWIVLRRNLSISWGWIPATSLWAAGYLMMFIFPGLGAFMGGALVGAGQSLVIKERLANAPLWIVISVISWGIAYLLNWFSVVSGFNLGYTGGFIFFHTIVAAVNGSGLVWLISGK
jgi:serine/threonine-protein kinase